MGEDGIKAGICERQLIHTARLKADGIHALFIRIDAAAFDLV